MPRATWERAGGHGKGFSVGLQRDTALLKMRFQRSEEVQNIFVLFKRTCMWSLGILMKQFRKLT